MKKLMNRFVLLGALCAAAAFALAYTTGTCVNQYPLCDHTKEGAQCGAGNVISFGDPQYMTFLYCGGNTSGRCGGPYSAGTCSELLYRPVMACMVSCGDTELGYCCDSIGDPVPTGYDCGYNPCPDCPTHSLPTPVGTPAPCNGPWGTPCVDFPTPPGN